MSNAQDLLSILGGGPGRPPRASAATSSGSSETSILSFKAGKMNTTLRPNGKYLVEPDSRRGELHVVWTTAPPAGAGAAATAGHLCLEWRDRRTKTVVNSFPVMPGDDATFERVETGREGDRVYLLQCAGGGADSRHFFWMQDKDHEPDEDLCVKVNLYISDQSEAAAAASSSGTADAGAASAAVAGASASAAAAGMDNAELLRIMQGALGSQSGASGEGARTVTVPGSGSIPTADAGQVDALGNILENLGVPRPDGTPAGERTTARGAAATGEGEAPAAGGAGGGGLTLADLQGAMAGLATASPPANSSAGPPLSELASSDIINQSGILNDPETVQRLIALLPEGQRTEEMLRENIRSPQVAQCLQRLTAALADEDAGGFNSIIANFQLDPSDGMSAVARGNPIEAFLTCLLRDVERREGVRSNDDKGGEEEEMKDGSGGEDGGGESKEDQGGERDDAKMDES